MFRKKTKKTKASTKVNSPSNLSEALTSLDNDMQEPPTQVEEIQTSTGDTAAFLKSLNDKDIIERVRVKIKNAHVFKLPPRQTVSVGWRGADWKDKVWQGTVKVVERGEIAAILLVDTTKDTIFAVCPIQEGAVDRCIDSSRYFVLRIQNENGGHMFIGVAFNERSDAFDFNTAMEDSKRERLADMNGAKAFSGPTQDYSIKEGEKIHVEIPKNAGSPSKKKNAGLQPQNGGTAAFADFYKIDSPDSSDMTHDDEKTSSASNSAVERRKQRRIGSVITPPQRGINKGLLKPSTKDTPKRSQNKSK